MRKYLRAAAVMVGVMASGGAWAKGEAEGRGETAELPAEVAERLQRAFPNMTVTEVSRWGSGFEAVLADGLRRQEVLLDAVGNVVERHVPVAVRELPGEVRATLDRTHPRHTVWRATRIETDAGVFHEVLLARGDQRGVVLLDPDARVLAGLKA